MTYDGGSHGYFKIDGGHLINCRCPFRISLNLGSLMYEVPHKGQNKASLPPSIH